MLLGSSAILPATASDDFVLPFLMIARPLVLAFLVLAFDLADNGGSLIKLAFAGVGVVVQYHLPLAADQELPSLAEA